MLDPLDVPTRLQALQELSEGWHEGQGQILDPKGLEWLTQQFVRHFPPEAPLPYTYPTLEGGVRMEWTEGDLNCILEVDLEDHSGSWLWFDSQSEAGGEGGIDMDKEKDWKMAGEGTSEQTGNILLTENPLLFRQVPPAWVQNGKATSQLFKLTRKDGRCLSAYDSREWTAADSWEHHVAKAWQSVGVLAVSMEECQNPKISVCRDDDPFIGHISICFEPISRSKQERIAEKLTRTARARGWLYKDPGSWKGQ